MTSGDLIVIVILLFYIGSIAARIAELKEEGK